MVPTNVSILETGTDDQLVPMRTLLHWLLTTLLFLAPALCLILEIEGKQGTDLVLARRDPVRNNADLYYTTQIKIGDRNFEVTLSTSTADLQVYGNTPGCVDTNLTMDLPTTLGPNKTSSVKHGTLGWSSTSVEGQLFLNLPADADNPDGRGILGLGPPSASKLKDISVPDVGWLPFMDRIFTQSTKPVEENIITFLLGRKMASALPFPGKITIGEILADYSAVKSQPKLLVHSDPATRDYFSVLLDEQGIFGNGDKPIPLGTTAVSRTENKKQLTAMIATDSSYISVPRAVADALFGQFKDSVYDSKNGQWQVPCSQEVNITIVIGGQKYSIHPLDATMDPRNIPEFSGEPPKTPEGHRLCLAAFKNLDERTSQGAFDIVLGVPFLRNTYTAINYGKFADQAQAGDAVPYVQLLSITDPAQAHSDFVTARITNEQNSKSSSSTPGSTTTLHPFPAPSDSQSQNKNKFDSLPSKTKGAIIASSIVAFALLISGTVWAWIASRRRNKRGQSIIEYRPISQPQSLLGRVRTTTLRFGNGQ